MEKQLLDGGWWWERSHDPGVDPPPYSSPNSVKSFLGKTLIWVSRSFHPRLILGIFLGHLVGMFLMAAWCLSRYMLLTEEELGRLPVTPLSWLCDIQVWTLLPILGLNVIVLIAGCYFPDFLCALGSATTTLSMAFLSAFSYMRDNYGTAIGLAIASAYSAWRMRTCNPTICLQTPFLLRKSITSLSCQIRRILKTCGLFLVCQLVYAFAWLSISTWLSVRRGKEEISAEHLYGCIVLLAGSVGWTCSVLSGLFQSRISRIIFESLDQEIQRTIQRHYIKRNKDSELSSSVTSCAAILSGLEWVVHVMEEEERGDSLIGLVFDRFVRHLTDTLRIGSHLVYVLLGIGASLRGSARTIHQLLINGTATSIFGCLARLNWSLSSLQMMLALIGAYLGTAYNHELNEADGMMIVPAGLTAVLCYWSSGLLNSILQATLLVHALAEEAKDIEEGSFEKKGLPWRDWILGCFKVGPIIGGCGCC